LQNPARLELREQVRVASSLGDQVAEGSAIEQFWRDLFDGRWSFVDHFDHDDTGYLVVSERPRASRRPLSQVERLVLRMVARGSANKEVAHALRISTSTVATHVRRALDKLGLSSRRRLWMIHAFVFGDDQRRDEGHEEREACLPSVSPRAGR